MLPVLFWLFVECWEVETAPPKGEATAGVAKVSAATVKRRGLIMFYQLAKTELPEKELELPPVKRLEDSPLKLSEERLLVVSTSMEPALPPLPGRPAPPPE